jgi:DNA end-binding protein Ku
MNTMARAVWSGSISFGLVSVPVRLYPATRRKDVRFHEIDRASGQRVRHQRVVETPIEPLEAERWPTPAPAASRRPLPLQEEHPPRRATTALEVPAFAQPVSAGDVLKGFEVAKDRYVTVGKEELEELAPERTRTIDVEQFVDVSAVDPLYYDISYYAVPDRGHERAYNLLVDAMRETRRIAIAWFVLRRKRYLVALRPHGRLMVLTTMYHADEILPASELEPSAAGDLSKKERDMAALLITTLAGPFEPERYPDEYRQRLRALIDGRAGSARPSPTAVPTSRGVQDLMSALRASVELARQERRRPKADTERARPAERPRKPRVGGKRKTA